ncbi:glycosylphosphatidylinositol-anchored high density lipoprotein-binding protein 1-like [Leguminivora glycinivorella]|uniref:glycosylphosphatidylinositol-anchored high density lipoprotein-binding protein 1-like n=1 Tax=Leguminivora glycinivorella TaxID=1035111 RepID=UPI0020103774|nr:glycosylphosphatidylinositol-anchored high density lipoprotein-binding protein 1-like [Leguminivora glycinivorella]
MVGLEAHTMVRWKYCLVLALLLLRTDAKDDDDDEEGEDNDDEEDDDTDESDEDEERADTMDIPPGRRTRVLGTPVPEVGPTPSRTTKRAPLECYVCGYRSEMPLRSCLDPAKYRVHSVTCHNLEDKCFTTVISKDKAYVAVIRGCRTGCVGSPDTTCCERDRCNNQAFAMPIVPRAHSESTGTETEALSTATKTTPSNVLFFVTVLLLLHTVAKVAFV